MRFRLGIWVALGFFECALDVPAQLVLHERLVELLELSKFKHVLLA